MGLCVSAAYVQLWQGLSSAMSLLAGYGQFATGMELDSIAGGSDRRELHLSGGVRQCHWHLVRSINPTARLCPSSKFNGTLSSWWTRLGVGLLTLIAIGIQSLFYMRKTSSR